MKKTKEVKKSQSAQLAAIKKKAFFALGLGAVLLILAVIMSAQATMVQTEQLEVTMALNQYRLGSKALTYAVQSYTVDGGESYYNAYMDELNVSKNRDKALEVLHESDITDEEWVLLNDIASMSEGLVPLENNAIESVKKGDLQAAQAYVFSSEYENTVNKINTATEDAIQAIQGRYSGKQTVCVIAQFVGQGLFVLAVVYLVLQLIKVIKFSTTELLVPIQKRKRTIPITRRWKRLLWKVIK